MTKTNVKYKSWSKEEIKFLNDNYKNYSLHNMASRLKRTYYATQTKMAEINAEGYEKVYNRAKTAVQIEEYKNKINNKQTIKSSLNKANKSMKITKKKNNFSLFWGLIKWQWN
jgi:DNA-binding SARP family transcriptional activator